MTSDPTAMTKEQIQQYREAVSALVAASLQQLRDYPMPATDAADPPGTPHE